MLLLESKDNVVLQGECTHKFKGVTASYMGISETVIQFVLYEHVRSHLVEAAAATQTDDEDRRKKVDFINFMLAGGTAKFFACVAAYPHGKF